MNAVYPYPAGTPNSASLPLEVWGTTDKGRVREGNEDTVFPHSDARTYAYEPKPELLAQKGQLLLVADGVGGAQAGSEASRWVRRVVVERYYDYPDPNPATALPAIITQANAALYQYLQTTGIREAGSTIVAAAIHQNVLYVAHVGDSRAYLLRNGQVYPLTRDHTLTQLKLMRGLITPEQAATDPDQGVLVRSMGAAPTVEVDVAQPISLAPGDVVLLCSDGLTDVVRDEEIAEVVRRHPVPRKAAAELVKLANRRGGPDNITIAIARVGGKAGAVPKPARQKPPRTAKPPAAPRARRGLRALTPLQWGILLGMALLVVALFLGLAALMTAGRGGGGAGTPTPTPPPTLPTAAPATPQPGTGGEGTPTPGPAPTATLRPTSTPTPTVTPRGRRTPTPTLEATIFPTEIPPAPPPGGEQPPPPPPPPPIESPPPPRGG